jgi:hypothetical protein
MFVRWSARLAIAAAIFLAGLPASNASSNKRLPVGVNIENPQWTSEKELLETLAFLQQNHVQLIRFPYAPSSGADYSVVNRFVERAYNRGIKSLIMVAPQYPADAHKRPMDSNTIAKWPESRLSDADPTLSRRFFDELFTTLDKQGVELAGIELGNEINWTQFNGDFPVPAAGRVLTLAQLENDVEGIQIAKGLDKYLNVFRELRSARDASSKNAHTPLVVAGLVETKSGWINPKSGADAADMEATIAYMRQKGLDDVVDAYSVHTYAGADGNLDWSLKVYRDLFLACRSTGKPCWLTEWGVNMGSKACPLDDQARSRIVATMLEQQNTYYLKGELQKSFYYGWWSPGTRFSLYACGAPTATAGEISKWSQ